MIGRSVPTWLGPCDDGTVDEYIEVNLANWNSRVAHHEHGYGLEQFRTDPAHLSDVVRFDRARLGSIEGLDVVHLQCHIGTDTLSLARLGARSVTGVDFSAPALEVATQLMPGELHDMSCLPAPVDGGRPPSALGAASGGG